MYTIVQRVEELYLSLPNLRQVQAAWFTTIAVLLITLQLCGSARGEGPPRITLDRNTCTDETKTVYVEHDNWGECLAYFVAGSLGDAKEVIIFMGGDMPSKRDSLSMFQSFAQIIGNAIYAYRDDFIPIILLARPGLYGSSGNHQDRHQLLEYRTVSQALDKLVARFRFTRVALVGHSGGSSALMGALSLGLKHGDCVIAASGGYEIADITLRKLEERNRLLVEGQESAWRRKVFSHHSSLDGLPRQPSQRFFIVGDPRDTFAPYAQQVRYVGALRKAGFAVQLVEAHSSYGDHHTLIYESLRAAARCLGRDADDNIARVLGGFIRGP